MSTYEAIFFNSGGKSYVGYPAQGTYERVPTTANLANRKYMFNVAGLSYRDWPDGGIVGDPTAFGVLVGPA